MFRGYQPKALSTPKTATVAEFGDCRAKRRLSPKSATVTENGDCRLKRRQSVDNLSPFPANSVTIVASVLWNSLPTGLRQTDIGYEQFNRLLKTYLFER